MDWQSLCGNCDFTTLIIGLVVLLGLFYFMKSKKNKNYPPGPMGLPLVGFVPFLGNNPGEGFLKLKEKYGSIISVRIGRDDWVVLNDYHTIHEALVKKGELFSGRPSNFLFDIISGGGKGVVMADYANSWKSLRKFGQVTLRGFGVGRKGMESNVVEETPFLIEMLTTENDLTLKTKLSYAVSNIICRVVFGSRFEYDDKTFVELMRIMTEAFRDGFDKKLFNLIVLAPFLRHFPLFRHILKSAEIDIAVLLGMFDKIKNEHMESYDRNDIRDFIDAFIKEIKQKDGSDKIFNDKQLLQYIKDLFEAGTETSTSTLYWMILCFAHYPEHQEKIAEEIHHVIGEDGMPTMEHQDEMPYTCAFIQEIQRHRTLVPLSILHKTNDNVTLNGYDIPKNTVIAPNIWGVHYDANLFENPKEFRPERFLDSDGRFVKSSYVIPFSVGPRHCLGEQLARMELFIFLTGIVQKLKILPDPNHSLPDFESGVFNMIFLTSHEFHVKFEKR